MERLANYALAIALAVAFAIINYRRHSPWGRLARRYASNVAISPRSLVFVRGDVGGARYSGLRAADVGVGLLLLPPRLLSFILPPILLPWDAVTVSLAADLITVTAAKHSLPVLRFARSSLPESIAAVLAARAQHAPPSHAP